MKRLLAPVFLAGIIIAGSGCTPEPEPPPPPPPTPETIEFTVTWQETTEQMFARQMEGMWEASQDWHELPRSGQVELCNMARTAPQRAVEVVKPKLAYKLEDREFVTWLEGQCEEYIWN